MPKEVKSPDRIDVVHISNSAEEGATISWQTDSLEVHIFLLLGIT